MKSLSHARLLATPWTAAYQAPPSMGFARQEYWSGVPLHSLACWYAAAAAAKSLQSCPNLWDSVDGCPPGSPVPGILQARTLEWVAISFSNARKWKVKVKSLSHARLLATPWTAAYQTPPSMGFSRHEYWSGVPLACWYTWTLFFFLLLLLIISPPNHSILVNYSIICLHRDGWTHELEKANHKGHFSITTISGRGMD